MATVSPNSSDSPLTVSSLQTVEPSWRSSSNSKVFVSTRWTVYASVVMAFSALRKSSKEEGAMMSAIVSRPLSSHLCPSIRCMEGLI